MLLEGGKLVQEEKGRLTVEKFQQFIDILTPSMDDYYIFMIYRGIVIVFHRMRWNASRLRGAALTMWLGS